MASYENVDYGSTDGCIIGKTAANKVGFYGATPVACRHSVRNGCSPSGMGLPYHRRG